MKTSKKFIFIACLLAAILLLSAQASHAASATWNLNPGSGDWQTATNWTPLTVPNGPADTATFALSNTTGVSLSANTEVNGIVFNAGASAFTITASPTFQLTISGVGITNNSGITENFVTAVSGGNRGMILFTSGATAGNGTFFTNTGGAASGVDGGSMQFLNNSTAGNGIFANHGGTVSGAGFAGISFNNTSTASNGTFTNNGATVSGAGYGFTNFNDSSTAGSGTFTNNGATTSGSTGGGIQFYNTSTAGSGIFTNNGGLVSGLNGGFTNFNDSSTALTGTFITNGGTVSGAFGGVTFFAGTSTASNAILIANAGSGGGDSGGYIAFGDDSTGGTARVEVFGNGRLDISAHNAPGVTIGSLEGSGDVFLGARNLTMGSNNLNTTFSGMIQDGGANGSFTKVGAGILTFEGGVSNNHIADTVTLTIASGSTVNLNFSGNADTVRGLIVDGVAQPPGFYGGPASGAPNQLPVFGGTGQIRVVVPAVVPPVITSPLSATATVGLPFTYQFETIGATSLGVSNLPPGFTFTTSLATITGAPTVAGIFQVGLSATNSFGTTNATLTITVQPAPAGLAIVSSTCATGRPGRGFSFQLQTSGSSATRFAVDALPAGLNLDPVTGFISGTPTSDGSFGVAVSAIDGAATAQATLQLTFTSDPTVPIITSPNNAILTPGQFFTYTITADANGTFGYIGTDGIVHQGPSSAGLPPGLSFDGNRTISGTFNPPFEHDGGPRRIPGIAGGIVTNVQLFATDPSGTGAFPLIGFIAAPGTVNISTRLAVGTGDNVLIGGFILAGTGTTRALIRAIGPSLTPLGVPNALQDPILELRDGAGALLGSNDNWRDNQSFPITDTGIPLTNNLESGILAFLSPGPYTAIVRGNNNTGGVALVEVYDLGIAALLPPGNARLANIATRGFADTGDNVMIGGFIVRPQAPSTSTRIIARAIGPSLAAVGVPNALLDPSLELKDGNGATLISNDDWQQGQPADIQEIQKLGLAPTDPRESAVIRTLLSGPYTAIVRGNGGTTGVGLVEVYSLE